ncbi:MAG: S1 family peptidase [bacterium]|nr:S1 family peptidase [bacterium]
MTEQQKLLSEFTAEELDRELIARGAEKPAKERFNFSDSEPDSQRDCIMEKVKKRYDSPPPRNEALVNFCTGKLIKALIGKSYRGIWGTEDGDAYCKRRDFYAIPDEKIKANAGSVAAICMRHNLDSMGNGDWELKVKDYSRLYNLCRKEPFNAQRVLAGPMCTGFLVKEDVVATAAHFANRKNVTELRIVFGFRMTGRTRAKTILSGENIYRGVEIIDRKHDKKGTGTDWALIKLDRKVEGWPVVRMSGERLPGESSLYVMGYPVGLPLKYAKGLKVADVSGACFSAYLDVYSGNSGSPVFRSDTHEVVGMISRVDNGDYRWTGHCYISMRYPPTGKSKSTEKKQPGGISKTNVHGMPDETALEVVNSPEPECTMVSEFKSVVGNL